MTASNTYGRAVDVPMTNKTGAGVIAGDVVAYDSTTNLSFTTVTAAASLLACGIAQETIASNAIGRIRTLGYCALVNTSGAVTRLNFGATHTVAKQAADVGASRITGTFLRFLSSGATPDAVVYPVDLAGAALTNPMTTKGDIIQGDTGGTPLRLGAGTSGYVLTAGGAGAFSAWAAPITGTYLSNFLSGDVSMTNANTYYDGPSVTLAAGTWLVAGAVCHDGAGNSTVAVGKIWDGTTVGSASQGGVFAAGDKITLSFPPCIVVVASGTPTWKISVEANGGSTFIRFKEASYGVAINASGIVAVRIA